MHRCLSLVLVTWLTCGCGAAPPAQRVRFADAARQGRIDWSRPVILEFQPGDRLPVRVAFSDQVFELSPGGAPLELIAKRRGFFRIESGHISGSLTGDDFDASPLAPGQFRFGLSVTKDGSWLELALVTPRHAEAGEPKP